MPFTGEYEGNIVWPDDVANGTTVVCPECGDHMHVRSGHTTVDGVLKPRCFAHNPDSEADCSGGESDTHKLMKYVVSRRLNRMYQHGTVEREKSIPDTNRIGDVVVTFDEPFAEFGRGLVAEVQYRNDSKDIEAVTQDVLQAGYSIYWIGESHFSEDYESVEFPEMITPWPNSVPESAEWSGIEPVLKELEEIDPSCPVDVKFPPEYFDDHRQDLEISHKIGAGSLDVHLARRLSEKSAERSCSECSNPADYYLFKDGFLSTFRCNDHILGGVRADGGESEYAGEAGQ